MINDIKKFDVKLEGITDDISQLLESGKPVAANKVLKLINLQKALVLYLGEN